MIFENSEAYREVLTKRLAIEKEYLRIFTQLINDLSVWEGKKITKRIEKKSELIEYYSVDSYFIFVKVKGITTKTIIGLTDSDKIYSGEFTKKRNPAYYSGPIERIANLEKILGDKAIFTQQWEIYLKIESHLVFLKELKKLANSLDNPAHYDALKQIQIENDLYKGVSEILGGL